jgi:hypothetical protein
MVERSVVRLLMLDVAADESAIEFGDGDHGLPEAVDCELPTVFAQPP